MIGGLRSETDSGQEKPKRIDRTHVAARCRDGSQADSLQRQSPWRMKERPGTDQLAGAQSYAKAHLS